MIILISGASHCGKTVLAQKILERHHYPYLSIDHLKMGLIRSGMTNLTVYDDEKLTAYLWPVLREIVKTAIENKQHLVIEGCYIPIDWKKDFTEDYLQNIRGYCLVMSENYIKTNFDAIKRFASVIESRLDDSEYTMENALEENRAIKERCETARVDYILIDDNFEAVLALA